MGSLASMWFKLETLETLVTTLKAKGEKGIDITMSINEDSNEYGNNISSYVSQTKEDREAAKPKFYVANGKVFWTDGKIVTAVKKDAAQSQPKAAAGTDEHDDLPF